MKLDPKAKKSISVGRAQAKRVLALRDKALRKRAKLLGERKKPAALLHTEAKRMALVASAGGSNSAGKLIAEGDSWFDYPFNDVIKSLEDLHGYDIDSVAHRGDRVEDMAYSDGQLDDLVRTLERQLRAGGQPPKAILLSGGGNDIAGDEFVMLLNHWKSPRRGLSEAVVRGVIDERLQDSYLTILGTLTEVCRARLGAPIRIVLHGYGYAVPDGRGFWGGFGPLPGPWLEPGFKAKGFPKNVRQAHVNQLIDRFNDMLVGVVATAGFAHVRYVDLRPELPFGADYKQWWANELHPTERGFNRVAERIARAIL